MAKHKSHYGELEQYLGRQYAKHLKENGGGATTMSHLSSVGRDLESSRQMMDQVMNAMARMNLAHIQVKGGHSAR